MKAPADCDGCVNCARFDHHDECANSRSFSAAWTCKTLGFHETVAQLRARNIREQEEHIQGLLREAQSHYTADQVARKALMVGVR